MKLKYKIAKTTEYDSATIIKRILALLDEEKYGIVDVTSNSVSFDDKRRLIVGNWEHSRRLHNGKFELIAIENTNAVLFEYYPIPLSEFIWVGAIVLVFNVFALANDVYFAGLITLPFIGQLIFKHYNLQRKANEMLDKIVA